MRRLLLRGCPLLLLGSVAACQSWRTQQVAPAQAVAAEQPKRVRVTEPNGSRLVVIGPTVAGDTLRGRSESDGYAIAIPIGDILKLETPKSNLTTSRIVAGATGLGFVIIMLACGVSSC
jgi:hypothetical protein